MWKTRPAFNLVNGLAVSKIGSGPQILLLHGVGLRMEFWNGLAAYFKEGFECVLVDLPGHGESHDASPKIIDVPSLTNAIEDAVKIQPEYIIGHSLGALVAIDWAAHFPTNLKAVVALNSIFGRSNGARNAALGRATVLQTSKTIDPSTTLSRWFGDTESPERSACHRWLTANRIDQYARAYEVFARSYGAEQEKLARLRIPALFLTGECEPNSTPAMSQTMANIAPHGHSHIVKDAAHMAPMTHAEEIAISIRNFFKNLGGES